MLKKGWLFLKKLVFSGFLLYGYNILAAPLKIIIPINVITLLVTTILGFPALLAFIIIHVLVF